MPPHAHETDAAGRASGSALRTFVIAVLSYGLVLFHFYTAFAGSYTPMVQRGVHLALGFALVFLLFRGKKELPRERIPFYDVFLATLAAFAFIYAIICFTEPTIMRMVSPTVLDKTLGAATILLVLEGTRRTTGNTLPIAVIGFLLYAFFGHHIPGVFNHAGVTFKDVISSNYMGLDGIFGVAIGSSATSVFVLVVLGITMMNIGGGDFFLKICYYLFGTVPGGPAKIAVSASALFATISGTGPTIVAATGPFTIPLMKRVGYRPHFAGAVEAVASNGGQIMPPVMGASAFIMAEILGITYWKVCVSAFIPALLFFFSVYTMVHLEAVRTRLQGLPKEEIPRFGQTMKEGWYYVFPVVLLIVLIALYESSPQMAGFYAMVALLVLEFVKQTVERRYDFRKVARALEAGVYQALVIITVCSAVGIIMAVMNITGIGLRLTSILIALSHGILPILLIISMIASLILGMGMSTVACYLIVAVLAAPAVVKMGVEPIAAHLFVFYFGIVSAITPPVALSAYIAAGIAGSPPMRTGWTAFRLGLSSFILPYMFIYNPALILLETDTATTVWAIATATFGIFFFSVSLAGFLKKDLNMLQRALCFCGSILMIYPGMVTDIIGLVMIGVAVSNQIGLLLRRRP